MDINCRDKYEGIEKNLKHWSYRALNLEGRITIEKSLAIPKITHLSIVLPELDEQKATKTEQPELQTVCNSENNLY